MKEMALSATGRTLRIRRQMPSYADSPQSEDMMEDDQAPSSLKALSGATGGLKLKRLKGGPGSSLSGKLAVRVQLDGPADSFVSATVVSASPELVPDEDAQDLSSDEEIFKDVRSYVRQTMGKPALLKAEAGICGSGEDSSAAPLLLPESSRSVTPWIEGGSNFVTVRHPAPDAPIDTPPLPGSEDGFVRAIYPNGLSYQLPLTCRHWFDPRYVSDIERNELDTFGVSESIYKELRDQLIDAYNVDPSKYLSVRNAREATGYGEVGVLTKLWAFLDYWGVINHLSDPSTAPRFSKKLVDFPIGRPSQALERIACSYCRKTCDFTTYKLKSEAAPLIPRDQVAQARFCSACIQTGNFPPFFSVSSFEPLDVFLPGTCTSEFTEEETMKLIEAIDRYGTDWLAVANMVAGGKTPAQCLLHFAQIPIMDRFGPDGPSAQDKLVPKPNPFRNETHSLLPVLKLLGAAVPPEVSAHVAGLSRSLIKSEDVVMETTKPEFH